MKKSKFVITIAVISVVILLISLTITLLDALIPWGLWVHPVLNFLFFNFVGFGIITAITAFKKSSPAYWSLSAIMLGLCCFYVVMQYTFWWIALIATIVLWLVFTIISVVVFGNKTEEIALNKSSDYKDYEQRKKEKEENKEKEPLPEIKSFK